MKVLVIHSYAIHGTASLKAILGILGSEVLPVPSLMLTGLTNMDGIRRFQLPFEELLRGTLDLVRQQQQQVLLYVGYLGSVAQVALIKELIETYRQEIVQVLVDPVTGDQGRIYVPDDIVEAWPDLLAIADWALPNRTEAQLYGTGELAPDLSENEIMEAFHDRFPNASFLVTSLSTQPSMRIGLFHKGSQQMLTHQGVDKHFGGTGDVFAAHFIQHHWQMGLTAAESAEKAAQATLATIQVSLKRGDSFLHIGPVGS